IFYDRRLSALNLQPLDSPLRPLLEDSLYYRRGECGFNLQNYTRAEEIWKSSQAASSGKNFLRTEIMAGLGQAYLAQHQWDDARQAYAQLLDQAPAYADREDTAVSLAILDYAKGDYLAAVKRLQNPETISGQYFKGRVLQALGKQIDAANYFNRVVKSGQVREPLYKNAFFLRGEAFLQAKDYGSALQSADDFVREFSAADPFSAYIRQQQYLILFEQKQYAKALQIASGLTASGKVPAGISADYLSAECLIHTEQVPKAYELYRKLSASLSPDLHQAAVLKQAWCAFSLKRYPEALKLIRDYVRTYPEDENLPSLQYLQGRCEALQGLDEQAMKTFRPLVERGGDPLFVNLCLLQYQAAAQRLGHTEELIRLSEDAIDRHNKQLPDEIKPARALSILCLGRAYFERSQYSRSVSTLQRIVDDFWDTSFYPYALDGMARSFFQDKNYNECIKTAQAGLGEKQLPAVIGQDLQLLLAHALFNQKKYTEALPNYQKWVTANPSAPEMPQILYLMGHGYVQIKFFKNALETWDGILRKYPRHPLCEKALVHSAELYVDGREYKLAITLYQRLLADWPRTQFAAQARLAIAQSRLALEDFSAAKTAYEEFLAKHPDDPNAAQSVQNLEQLAFQLAVKGNTPESLNSFITQFPQSQYAEQVRFLIGEMYFGRQQYEKASGEFTEMSKKYPESKLQPQILFLIGQCADQRGDTTAAMASYLAFAAKYSRHELMPDVQFQMAADYFHLNNLPAAVQAFKDFADRFPENKAAPQALYNLSMCFQQQNKEKELMDVLATLAKKYPQSPEGREALARLGNFFHEQKDFSRAAEYLGKLVDAGGGLPAEVYYRLGDSYENLKKPKKALGLYTAARKCRPLDDVFRVVALSQLAALYEQENRLEEALGVYRDIAKNAQEEKWRTAAADRIKLLRGYLNESGN
ncbi:MAG: tetratricopeptide repeat protein, partial [Candidatus Firestonebacteria bacterium]|nr:tetratricopeptide repeat protein [Candidatus Firestonebacteria bacterium]